MRESNTRSLQERLADIGKHSERHFLALAADLPALMRELHSSLDSAKGQLDQNGSATHGSMAVSSAGSPTALSDVWGETRDVFAESTRFFTSLSEQDDKSHGTLSDTIRQLSSMDDDIVELREDAIDLEVAAINASITARRAGESGLGFAYVASELQRVASAAARDTAALRETGARALGSLDRFSWDVQDSTAFQREFFGSIETRLQSGFEQVGKTISALREHLQIVVDGASDVELPLKGIMAQIQVQDIIMQSLQNVELVVQHSRTDGVVVTEDGATAAMAPLCAALLKDTQQKLRTALDEITVHLKHLSADLVRITEDCGSPDLGGCVEDATDVASLNELFDNATDLLAQVVKGIEDVITRRSALQSSGGTLASSIGGVVRDLTGLSHLLETLYPIQVMSHIQVAKVPALSDHSEAIDGIADFVEKARTNVGGTESDLSDGLARLERQMERYTREYEVTADRCRNLADRIGSAGDALVGVRERTVQEFDRFSVFSTAFLDRLEAAREHLAGLESIDSMIRELIAEVEAQVEGIEQEVASSDVHSIMESLLDQFTIARHKVSAGSLAGIDVESGDKEGELTLF